MNIQYQYPIAFWLLLLVPFFLLLFITYRLWRRRIIRRTGDARIFKSLFPAMSPVRPVIKFLLVLGAVALGCLAVANPRVPDASAAGSRKGIDLVVALDVSNSMLATDVEPDRITKAKYFISRLVRQLPEDRVGLVTFAGNAYMQLPLTFDHDVAQMYVTSANPASITAQGTSISDALKKSDLVFGDEDGRFRSVLLITDGETHDEDALDMAKELAGKGVMINTIGIGSPGGATVTDPVTKLPKTDPATGQTVISRLNDQLLVQLAQLSNGTYVHLQDADDAVSRVMQQYSAIEKKALPDASMFNYETYYAWLVIPMLLLLLVEIFLSERKKLKA